MATPAQVANDLAAQAAMLHQNGSGNNQIAASMKRGAETIRRQCQIIAELEAAAQAEADRHETYVNGDDQHA
ncbi:MULTISPECIES: hypothetical protein [unclassified Yoonia]|uniref:hypothetical protein n=1 Tax=unclassified Yoonia TaxID=2629118 RepID=UPI002AFE70FF|nr:MULTISPECIES: hypothetical protein [unclassified Yoonia]